MPTMTAESIAAGGDDLLGEKEARELLGPPGKPISKQRLLVFRRRKKDPLPFLRAGRRAQYVRSELINWMRRNARREP